VNRFGETVLDPILLLMDGRLKRVPMDERPDDVPQATARAGPILGYTGSGPGFAEVRTSVNLGRYGGPPQLNASGIPRRKLKQLLEVLGEAAGLDLSGLSCRISVFMPGMLSYSEDLDLAVAVSLVSSYLNLAIPEGTLFLGKVDPAGRVRPPTKECMESLAAVLYKRYREIGTVFISDEASLVFCQIPMGTDEGVAWQWAQV
jgi:DNA repair protein RadA/Sms